LKVDYRGGGKKNTVSPHRESVLKVHSSDPGEFMMLRLSTIRESALKEGSGQGHEHDAG